MQKVCSSENVIRNYRKNTMVSFMCFWKKAREKSGKQKLKLWCYALEWSKELWKMNLWAEWTGNWILQSRWAKFVLNESKNQMKCMICKPHSASNKKRKKNWRWHIHKDQFVYFSHLPNKTFSILPGNYVNYYMFCLSVMACTPHVLHAFNHIFIIFHFIFLVLLYFFFF